MKKRKEKFNYRDFKESIMAGGVSVLWERSSGRSMSGMSEQIGRIVYQRTEVHAVRQACSQYGTGVLL